MNGSLQPFEYPSEMVRLAREKCGRRANTESKNWLSDMAANMRLPDLREEIAQCDRAGKMHDACMVRYVDLIARR